MIRPSYRNNDADRWRAILDMRGLARFTGRLPALAAAAHRGVLHAGRRWLTSLTLWQRMALGISLGFPALFAAFSALGERALHNSIDRILEERLSVAQMAADHFDGLLRLTITDLAQTRRLAAFDPHQADLSAESDLLAHGFDRLHDYVAGLVLLDAAGRIVLGQPAARYPAGSDGQPRVEIAAVESEPRTEAFGHEHRMAGAPLRGARLGVAVGGDVAGIFAGVLHLRRSLALLSAVALVGAWTVTLAGMQLRASPAGRRMTVQIHPGQGTTVQVTVPLAAVA